MKRAPIIPSKESTPSPIRRAKREAKEKQVERRGLARETKPLELEHQNQEPLLFLKR